MTGTKRPPNDWYTPYFAPTTVLIAVTVLVLSVEAGKYVGNYYIQADNAAANTAPVTVGVPANRHAPTKAAGHTAPSKARGSSPGKTQH